MGNVIVIWPSEGDSWRYSTRVVGLWLLPSISCTGIPTKSPRTVKKTLRSLSLDCMNWCHSGDSDNYNRLRKHRPNTSNHSLQFYPLPQHNPPAAIGAWPSYNSRSDTMVAQNSEHPPQSRPPLTGQNHSRASSFFSFRSKSTIANDSGPQRSVSTMTRPQANGTSNGSGVDDFGRQPQASPQQMATLQQTRMGSPQQPPQQNPSAPQPPAHQQQQLPQNAITRTLSTQIPNTRPTLTQPVLQPLSPSQPLHPEIRSVVQLTVSHANKIYFSGPLVRRIERQTDGQPPAKDEGWVDVWAQLGGTTLSIWDMAQIQEASKQGKEVPPTYVNMTDAVSYCIFYIFAFAYIDLHVLITLIVVYSSIGICDCPCHGIFPSEKIHERAYTEYRRIESLTLLMSIHCCAHVVGWSPQTVCVGEIAFGRNIYRTFDKNYS
jgi:hypothetical protein